jgi:mannosyl-oligosaccharide alpha-1,2-mannosidase
MDVAQVRIYKSAVSTYMIESLIMFSNLAGIPEQPHSYVISAEFGSMAMEFTRLSQLTGDPRFYDAVKRIADVLEREQSQTKIPGLWPVVFDAQKENFREDFLFTLGGRADSLYEYVPKVCHSNLETWNSANISQEYILLGGQSEQHRRMYTTFIAKAKEHFFFKPMNPDNLDILLSGSAEAQTDSIKLKPEGQHLSCFVGGMVALASKTFELPEDMVVAKKLVDGCSWAYSATDSGIMPEVFMAVPPGTNPKNKWDKGRWLQGINEMHPVGSPDEVKDANARAEKIASSLRIPKGMTSVTDRRYILR